MHESRRDLDADLLGLARDIVRTQRDDVGLAAELGQGSGQRMVTVDGGVLVPEGRV